MPEIPEMFLALQRATLETAKQLLRREGRLHPIAFVFTRENTRATEARLASFQFGCAVTPMKAKAKDHSGSLLTIPLDYGTPAVMLNYLEFIGPNETRAALRELRTIPIRFGREKADAMLLRVFTERMGVYPKDIAARFLQAVCAEVKAEAIIKIDEIWSRQAAEIEGEDLSEAVERVRREMPADLSSDPEAGEAIASSLETHAGSRLVCLPFTREGGRGYPHPFKCFGEESVSAGILEGRFAHLLASPEVKQ